MPKKSPFPFEIPDYIKHDPASFEDTRKVLEGLDKTWHQLRQQGVTLPFLEYQEVTDPELMDKPLTEEYARRKYAKAIAKVRSAKKRNAAARIKGGKAKKETALTIEKLIALLNTPESLSNNDLFHAVKNYQNRSFPKTYLAEAIKKHTNISHSVRTIRCILTDNGGAILADLAKATPQNK